MPTAYQENTPPAAPADTTGTNVTGKMPNRSTVAAGVPDTTKTDKVGKFVTPPAATSTVVTQDTTAPTTPTPGEERPYTQGYDNLELE